MYKDQTICVIIAAAGSGSRMGGSINKQYMLIEDMPVLAHAIRRFEEHSAVDEITVVVREGETQKCKREIVERYGFAKVRAVVAGGANRQDSVREALSSLRTDAGYVLVQDGARPFATQEMISDAIRMAFLHGAAAAGVPVKDTIKVADENSCVLSTPDRKTLYAIQTPQAFRADLLYEAFQKAYEQGFYGTDEMVLLERLGKKVYISKGSYGNIKITTPEDIAIAKALSGLAQEDCVSCD